MDKLLYKLQLRGQSIEDFDGIELCPMKRHISGGVRLDEECEDFKDASFYTVFGHLKRGGRDDFQDFWVLLDAENYVATLIHTFPHLAGERID